ncbi:MAG: TonB-dependent receptor [Gammaproteobacteria bacterium]
MTRFLKAAARAVCATIATLPLLGVPASSFAQQASSERAIELHIAAGTLQQALDQLARQSGIQFVYNAALGKGRTVGRFEGKASVREVLDKLLVGTGLQYRFTDASTVVLQPESAAGAAQGARTLGPVRVEGATSAGAVAGVNGSTDATATEGTGSYTSSALSIASKTPLSIKDTPQSVSVITQQRMQDQNITDFRSLMNEAPGVSVVTEYDSMAPTFFSRGFAIQRLQVDGGAPMDISGGSYGVLPQIDMAMYDHAEVLRGADGLFNGYGNVGGVINLTRKRPLDHPQIVSEMQAGSWGDYRATLDATAPLGFDGRLRGRGVLMYQDQHFFYDTASNEKTLAYGILEYDLTPTTLVSVGVDSTQQNSVPFLNGLPRYDSGADLNLPRSTCLCFPWNRYDFNTTNIFAQLSRSLGNDWNLKANLTRTLQQRFFKYGTVSGSVNPVTLKGPAAGGSMSNFDSTQRLADLTLDGGFQLFGHKQMLVVGANYATADGAGHSDYLGIPLGSPSPPVDVFNFDPNKPMYSEPAFSWPPTWSLSYDVTRALTVYGSYTTIYRDQSTNVETSLDPVPPITGSNAEGGLKWSGHDGKLNATLSFYRVEQKNLAMPLDGTFSNVLPDGIHYCCYTTDYDYRFSSEGTDLEATGEVLPGWQVSASYTWNLNEYKGAAAKASEGLPLQTRLPRHLAKLWSSYRFQSGEWLRRLEISGGVNTQSKGYYQGSACPIFDDTTGKCAATPIPYAFTQGFYAVFSARAAYQVDSRWSAALNVNNLLDRTYYETVGGSGAGNYYGEPRNLMLSVRGSF